MHVVDGKKSLLLLSVLLVKFQVEPHTTQNLNLMLQQKVAQHLSHY